MEKSGVILVLQIFVGLTEVMRKFFDFVYNTIVCRRRVVKSTNVLKQVYQGNFVLRSYDKLVNFCSNNKIL